MRVSGKGAYLSMIGVVNPMVENWTWVSFGGAGGWWVECLQSCYIYSYQVRFLVAPIQWWNHVVVFLRGGHNIGTWGFC